MYPSRADFSFDRFRRLMGYYSPDPVYVSYHDFAYETGGGFFRMAAQNIGEAPAKTFAE